MIHQEQPLPRADRWRIHAKRMMAAIEEKPRSWWRLAGLLKYLQSRSIPLDRNDLRCMRKQGMPSLYIPPLDTTAYLAPDLIRWLKKEQQRHPPPPPDIANDSRIKGKGLVVAQRDTGKWAERK